MTRLSLTALPRSSRTMLVATEAGFKIKVAAPPVDGEANKEICAFIAALLGLPRSAVTVAAGGRGKRKTLSIEGLDEAAVLQCLKQHLEAK